MHVDGLSLAIYPQRTVRTHRTHRRPDMLLVAACNGRRMTLVVETDSPEVHTNPVREAERDDELGVPVLHIHPAHVGHPRFFTALLRWIRRQFE